MGGFFSTLGDGFKKFWNNIMGSLWDSGVIVAGTFVMITVINSLFGLPWLDAIDPMVGLPLIAVPVFMIAHSLSGVLLNSLYDFFKFAS